MRHRIVGKQLSRNTGHRRSLRRNLAASLIEHGTVRTTPAKAKEVRGFVEGLITIARKGTLHARRQVIAMLTDRAIADKETPGELEALSVVQKLFDEVAPRYQDRPGGYTRIIHLPERRIGDGGRQVLLQLVEEEKAASGGKTAATASARRKRAARRAEAARQADQPQPPAASESAREAAAHDQPAPAEPADQGEPGQAADQDKTPL